MNLVLLALSCPAYIFTNVVTHFLGQLRIVLDQAPPGSGGYLLNWQIEGEAFVDQGGMQVRLLPGSIATAIVNGRRPMLVLFPHNVQRIVAKLPARIGANAQAPPFLRGRLSNTSDARESKVHPEERRQLISHGFDVMIPIIEVDVRCAIDQE